MYQQWFSFQFHFHLFGVYSQAQKPRCHFPTMWVLYPLSFNSVGNIVKPVERFREIRGQVISIDSWCQANRELAPVGTPPARRGFKARCWRPRWNGYLSRRSFFSYLAVYVGLTSSTVFAFFCFSWWVNILSQPVLLFTEVIKICVNPTLEDDSTTQSTIYLPVRSAALLGVHTWSNEKIEGRFSA